MVRRKLPRSVLPLDIGEAVKEARQRQGTLATILDYFEEIAAEEWTPSHRDAVGRAETELEIIERCTRDVLSQWDLSEKTNAAEAAQTIRESLRFAQRLCSAGAQELAIFRQLFSANRRRLPKE
jgi:hypothetical protein